MTHRIQTRQHAVALAASSVPLKSGELFTGPISEIDGYAELPILAISDQPFTVKLLEASEVFILQGVLTGNFVQAQPTLTATISGSVWKVSTRLSPTGTYGKFVLANAGGDMTELSFQASGLPLP